MKLNCQWGPLPSWVQARSRSHLSETLPRKAVHGHQSAPTPNRKAPGDNIRLKVILGWKRVLPKDRSCRTKGHRGPPLTLASAFRRRKSKRPTSWYQPRREETHPYKQKEKSEHITEELRAVRRSHKQAPGSPELLGTAGPAPRRSPPEVVLSWSPWTPQASCPPPAGRLRPGPSTPSRDGRPPQGVSFPEGRGAGARSRPGAQQAPGADCPPQQGQRSPLMERTPGLLQEAGTTPQDALQCSSRSPRTPSPPLGKCDVPVPAKRTADAAGTPGGGV